LPDPAAGTALYRDALGLALDSEDGAYFHTERLPGVKHFALWPLSQAARSCFGADAWPADVPVPQAWIEFEWTTSRRRRRNWRRGGTRCSWRGGRSRGGRP
jgi:hypothetical protein